MLVASCMNNPLWAPGQQGVCADGTVQYDLGRTSSSRLEVRWDHGNQDMFGGSDAPSADAGPDTKNAVLIAANLI